MTAAAREPSPSWRPPSHRADRVESNEHVPGDYWCACRDCESLSRQRTRLLSMWMLDDACALEATVENDNARRESAPTVRPPAFAARDSSTQAAE